MRPWKSSPLPPPLFSAAYVFLSPAARAEAKRPLFCYRALFSESAAAAAAAATGVIYGSAAYTIYFLINGESVKRLCIVEVDSQMLVADDGARFNRRCSPCLLQQQLLYWLIFRSIANFFNLMNHHQSWTGALFSAAAKRCAMDPLYRDVSSMESLSHKSDLI